MSVASDGEHLLPLHELILLAIKAVEALLEGLDFDSGLLDQGIGDGESFVLAVLLDGLAEEAGDLAGEVAIGMGELDVDHEGRALRCDRTLATEDLLGGERAGEDIAALIGLEHGLALASR